jgi:hypothetical protein
MVTAMRTALRWVLLLGVLVTAILPGCAQVMGIEEPTLDETVVGGDCNLPNYGTTECRQCLRDFCCAESKACMDSPMCPTSVACCLGGQTTCCQAGGPELQSLAGCVQVNCSYGQCK